MTITPHNRNVLYSFKKEHFANEEQHYCSYSILIFENHKIIRYVPDVFLHKSDAEKFVSLCNKYALSPLHLDDFIEDFYV